MTIIFLAINARSCGGHSKGGWYTETPKSARAGTTQSP